jgi:RhoGEF domain
MKLENALTCLSNAEMERDSALKKVDQYQSRIESMHKEDTKSTNNFVSELKRLYREVEDLQRQCAQLGEALRISEQKRQEALAEVVSLQDGLERLQSSSAITAVEPTSPAAASSSAPSSSSSSSASSTSTPTTTHTNSSQPGSSPPQNPNSSHTSTTVAAVTSSSSLAQVSPPTDTIFDEDDLQDQGRRVSGCVCFSFSELCSVPSSLSLLSCFRSRPSVDTPSSLLSPPPSLHRLFFVYVSSSSLPVDDDPDLSRALIASELVKVEQHYVRDLTLVEEVFVQPLRELQTKAVDSGSEEVLPDICHQEIFSSLEIILSYHRVFYEQLELRILGEWRSQQPQERVVGDVLQGLVKHLAGYFGYISNYAHALATIRKCTKSYPLFR